MNWSHPLLLPYHSCLKSIETLPLAGLGRATVLGSRPVTKDGRRLNEAFAWQIEPDQGTVLGTTSAKQPFLTLEIDLSESKQAKSWYPRYVDE